MKKIIILMLLVLLSMQTCVSLAEDEEAYVESPALEFTSAMGITDADTNPASAVKRIELAKIFYKIVMADTEAVSNSSRYFTDVSYDDGVYADFVYQSGIMNGVGNGAFAPDVNVTYAQLLKTVVAFLGYSVQAEAKGGYPYGYLAQANQLDIIGASPDDINSFVTADTVASVFRLATNANLMEQTSYGSDYTQYEKKDQNYLEVYMDITRIRGVVTANYLADIDGDSGLEYNEVKIDDKTFYITQASESIITHIGCEVDIYVKNYKKSSATSIIFYELSDSNNVLSVDGQDVAGVASYKLCYYVGDKEATAKIHPTTKVIYNGSYVSGYDEKTLNPFSQSSLEGSLRLIDNNDDSIYDVVIVDAYNSYVVRDVVNNVIFCDFSSETFNLGSDFEDGDIEITNVIGQQIEFAKIEKGDIISVSKDVDGNVKRIVVTIDTFSGTLSEINKNKLKICLDGNEFDASPSLFDSFASDYTDIKLGTDVTVCFNKDGKICSIIPSELRYKTGYLTMAKKLGTLEAKWVVRIFSSSGDFEELKFAEKVTVKGEGIFSPDSVIQKACTSVEKGGITSTDGNVVRQVIRYRTNNDGDIEYIEFATSYSRDGLYVMEGFDGSTPETVYYNASQKNFSGKLLLDTNTIIFNVPEESDAQNWSRYYVDIYSYYAEGDRKTDFIAYSTSDDESPCAEIMVEYDGRKGISASADIFVVDEVTEAIDGNGDEKIKLVGYLYGEPKTYYVEKYYMESGLGFETLSRGDVVKFRTFDGEIKLIDKVFDIKKQAFLKASTNSETNITEYVETTNPTNVEFDYSYRYVYGDVLYNNGDFIKVKIPETGEVIAYPLTDVKVIEVDFSNDPKGKVGAASSKVVYDSVNYSGYSSKVIVHTRKGAVRAIVVYNGMGGSK